MTNQTIPYAHTTWNAKDGYRYWCSEHRDCELDERTNECSRCDTKHKIPEHFTEEDFCDLKNRAVGA